MLLNTKTTLLALSALLSVNAIAIAPPDSNPKSNCYTAGTLECPLHCKYGVCKHKTNLRVCCVHE